MSVIELNAKYRLIDGLSASVTVECNLERLNEDVMREEGLDEDEDGHSQVILTLLHENFVGKGEVTSYDFSDNFTLPLTVYVGESLTMIARHKGCIIGCLVNEVDTDGASRVLLHPKGGYNVIVYQERQLEATPPAPNAAATMLASTYS